MNKRENKRKPTGRTNTFRILAGGYLVYIAYGLIRDLDETSMPALGVAGAVVFAAFGGYLLWREWQAYRYGMEHKDDPSTWSDEPVEELTEAADEELEVTEDFDEIDDEAGEAEEDEA